MSEFQERLASREDVVATHYEDDDRAVFVADLGASADGAVDIVDGTAMVVIGDEQYEFSVPAGETTARVHNGVVTVEVSRE